MGGGEGGPAVGPLSLERQIMPRLFISVENAAALCTSNFAYSRLRYHSTVFTPR